MYFWYLFLFALYVVYDLLTRFRDEWGATTKDHTTAVLIVFLASLATEKIPFEP